ncbi:CoA transferase [Herbiconiux sp. L3-i23]|uniref:CoA transferase n=1 Tax=Herbiconiux sp. L3-i23 TaxID=2905871 RepID=UPI002048E146|nr:CoA transferase [Herbiconiux sp. L3-i23]BDI21272.1 putative L-carnitine dehydratase [Herbiconiux sp. L3-i23]
MSAMTLLERIWSGIGGDPAAIGRVDEGPRPAGMSEPLWRLTHDSIAAAALQASELAGGSARVRLDTDRVLTSVTSERHFLLDGQPPQIWSDLSGFWRSADGWMRTHTNYPHHRERLLRSLDLAAGATVEEFAVRVAMSHGADVESRAAANGALAVRVRSVGEWRAHPVGAAVGDEPLIGIDRDLVNAPTRSARGSRPLDGVRVLDLTRVIAGPVASRTLALFGADVLRVDSPDLVEPEWQHLDSGAGKRSALLRLSDRSALDDLLAGADVVPVGYRPGSLDRFGLDPAGLSARYPSLVVGRLDAWGWGTEWSSRRGFDSLVQAASGIAATSSADGDHPGALPYQALDHASGYLLATGVMRALQLRDANRGGSDVRVSLARTAHELLGLGFAGPEPLPSFEPTVTVMVSGAGRITSTEPAPAFAGSPTTWPAASRSWGGDEPRWLERQAR